MRSLLLCSLLVSLAVGAPPAQAQSLAKAKLALHAVASNTASCDEVMAACSDAGISALTTSVDLGLFDVYVLAVDIDPAVGFAGVTYGFEYGPGLILDFFSCSSLAFTSSAPDPVWPASGSGVTQTYVGCQNGVDPSDPEGEALVVLGWAEVEALGPSTLSITPRLYLPSPDAAVADCGAASTALDVPGDLGKVGFSETGYDPCVEQPVPVEETTWGRIKQGLVGR